ncbi:glycoside hydrolase family 43 protein [Microbacterium deminutum]|uniref:Glycoside hydrolase n=1 Tax=Microbacterium deminutum TaxID=344164 RepID=A0ABP5CX64_9MICO
MDPSETQPIADIRVRDPFLLTVSSERAYYLFGSGHVEFMDSLASGFDCYRSTDLESWQGPFPAFRSPAGFWADRNFWAPEVHAHAGRYFMFATFDANGVARGTQVLVADRPAGPYLPWSDGPLTPVEWDCSGGTLHLDDAGDPWIVFCHDRTQFGDSEIVAQRLSADLTHPVGQRILLFQASDATWATRDGAGPFLHRLRSGQLVMLWSSPTINGSAMGISRSETGRITGRWIHDSVPLLTRHGGHGMIAKTLDGGLLLTWHQPDIPPYERAVMRPVVETRKSLQVHGRTRISASSSSDDPDLLRGRLAQIQIERARVLGGSFVDPNHEDASEGRSDALHDLATEEARIHKALDLPPGPWDPGKWPEWGSWLLLTVLVAGILLLVLAAG